MRKMVRLLIVCLLVCVCCGCEPWSMAESNRRSVIAEAGIREGDILFQTVGGELGDMVADISRAPYNHCGMVLQKKDGSLVVLEAMHTVRQTPIEEWMAGGKGPYMAVYRFTPQYQAMLPMIVTRTRMYEGRPYDYRFRLQDEPIYCSELLYRGFADATGGKLGMTVRLMDLPWQKWKKQIEALEKGPVPVERELILPRNIAASRPLQKVWSNYPQPW